MAALVHTSPSVMDLNGSPFYNSVWLCMAAVTGSRDRSWPYFGRSQRRQTSMRLDLPTPAPRGIGQVGFDSALATSPSLSQSRHHLVRTRCRSWGFDDSEPSGRYALLENPFDSNEGGYHGAPFGEEAGVIFHVHSDKYCEKGNEYSRCNSGFVLGYIPVSFYFRLAFSRVTKVDCGINIDSSILPSSSMYTNSLSRIRIRTKHFIVERPTGPPSRA